MTANAVTKISSARIRKLVDARGLAKLARDQAQEKLDQLDAQLKDLGAGEYFGKAYKASVAAITGVIFDQAKAKSLLTPAQLGQCLKPNSYLRVLSKEILNVEAS